MEASELPPSSWPMMSRDIATVVGIATAGAARHFLRKRMLIYVFNPKMSTGVFPVLNALQAGRRTRMYRIYVLATLDLAARKDAGAVKQLLAAAKEQGIPTVSARGCIMVKDPMKLRVHVTRHELNTLSNDRPHQGFVLDCSPLTVEPLDELPSAASFADSEAPPIWLALDEVADPQNFGAILRSAYCLGASGLLTAGKNCAPLSPAVSKASAGAMEVCVVHSSAMMQRTLADAMAKGWTVLGASGEAGAIDSTDLKVTGPTVLVVGSEGSGLRTNVRRACTGLVQVRMGMGLGRPNTDAGTQQGGGRAVAVDSLNVAVATAVLLHDLLRSARGRVGKP